MTVQWGDTGRVAYGPLKTFTTTLATPRETLLGTPVVLPTAEPGTSQISITVSSGDLPTISPSPISVKYSAILYAAGKNTDAASQSVSWRILKNSVSVATGTQTGVATNTFWTQQYDQFFDVAVSDVLEIRLWSTSANVNYDYYAIAVMPTRLNLGKSYINKDVNYSNFIIYALTAGTPSINLSTSPIFYASDSTTLGIQTGATVNFGALRWNQTYNAYRGDHGDNNQTTVTNTHATSRPYYRRSSIPGTISFREVLR